MKTEKFEELYVNTVREVIEKNKLVDRFKRLDEKLENLYAASQMSSVDEVLMWERHAAFMHDALSLKRNALPVSNETILSFLSKDDKNKSSKKDK